MLAFVFAAHLPVAQAQTKSANEPLILEGIALRKKGRHQEALRKFREAHKLEATPRASAQLGLCEQALGQWVEGEDHLEEALKASNDPWISKNLPVLEESIGRARDHIGRVEVIGSPDGAEVAVNGRTMGTLPLTEPVRVAEGNVDIEVRKMGFKSSLRSVTTGPRQYQRVVIRLEADRSASATRPDSYPSANMATDPAVGAGNSLLVAKPNEGAEQNLPFYKAPVFWVVVGAAVVVGAVAAVFATSGTTYPSADHRLTY